MRKAGVSSETARLVFETAAAAGSAGISPGVSDGESLKQQHAGLETVANPHAFAAVEDWRPCLEAWHAGITAECGITVLFVSAVRAMHRVRHGDAAWRQRLPASTRTVMRCSIGFALPISLQLYHLSPDRPNGRILCSP